MIGVQEHWRTGQTRGFARNILFFIVGIWFAEAAGGQVTGDFNNDGFDDLAIPVPNESVGDAQVAGAVHVIFGAAAGLKAQDSQYWHNDKPHITGQAESNDRFGDALAVGDFDDDGFDDLAIGIPNKSVGGHEGAGAVLVLRGKDGGLSTHGSSWWTQDVQGLIDAAGDLEGFGTALTAGDFNGDGFADLAVSTPREAGPGSVGSVHVLYGSEDGLVVEGNQFFKRGTGRTLATGDFDNDGFDDLVIGSPDEEVSGQFSAGMVRVLSGTAEGVTSQDHQKWSQDAGGIPEVAEPSDNFGYSLAVGDFNDNGWEDLAIGAPRERIGSAINGGWLLVLHGSAVGLRVGSWQVWTQDSEGVTDKMESSDFFGQALAADDFDGDGFADLAIGVPGESISGKPTAGAVHILHGSDERLTAAGDQFWHQNSGNVLGTCAPGDRFGVGLAAGDFNGDGFADLAVSIAFEDTDGVFDSGALAVLYGTNAGLSDDGNQIWHQNKTGINDECEPNDQFGGVN
jgi:hypothetical protein